MRKGRNDDWDDDWDDDVVEQRLPESEGLSTRKILWGLLGVVLIALVIGSLVSRDEYQFQESPPQLRGMWTCTDPEKSDIWVEFRREFIVFGTGGTGTLKVRILGFKFEQVGGLDRYTVFYRELSGKEYSKEIVMAPPGDTLRFAEDPGVDWARFEQ